LTIIFLGRIAEVHDLEEIIIISMFNLGIYFKIF